MGNTLSEDRKSVSTNQFVNPDALAKLDIEVGDKNTGGYMLHEVMESYYGGTIALEPRLSRRTSSPRQGVEGSTYDQAHSMANSISKGGFEDVYKNKYTPCAFGAYEKWGFRYDIERVKTGKIKRSN